MMRMGSEESINVYVAKSPGKKNLLFWCYVLVTNCNDPIFDECVKNFGEIRFLCNVGVENLSTQYARQGEYFHD